MSKVLFEIEVIENSITRRYLTTNWVMKQKPAVDLNSFEPTFDMYLIGDFYSSPISWFSEIKVTDFHVTVVTNEEAMKKFQAAVDRRRMDTLIDSVRGLAENLFEKNLPAEIKEILERTPDVGTSVIRAVESGLTSLFDKITKDK